MTENPPQPAPDLRAFCEQETAAMLDRLYAAALRLTKERCDAEDLVADTIVKVLDNLHTLQDRASFRGWVFRILEEAQDIPRLWAECVVGAVEKPQYVLQLAAAGFRDVTVIEETDYFSHSNSEHARAIAATFGANSIVIQARKPEV